MRAFDGYVGLTGTAVVPSLAIPRTNVMLHLTVIDCISDYLIVRYNNNEIGNLIPSRINFDPDIRQKPLRERAAIAAMQSLIIKYIDERGFMSGFLDSAFVEIGKDSVALADGLIKELNKDVTK